MASMLKRMIPAILATALLEWFGTGLEPLWPLAWLAPVPMMLFALDAGALATAGASFVAWFAGAFTSWHYFHDVLRVPTAMPLMIFGLLSVVFVLTVLLFGALMRRGAIWAALFGTPALWVTAEYANSLTSVHGTYGSLSYTQLDFLPILQLASITGPWGISFVLLLSSAALAIGIGRFRQPRARLAAGVGLAIALIAVAFGTARLAEAQAGERIKVGLLASDSKEYVFPAEPGESAAKLFAAYAEQIGPMAEQGVQVVVMPEKLAVVLGQDDKADAILQETADRTGVQIVAGLIRVEDGKKFNEASLYTPNAPRMAYDKQHMLPPFESDLTPGVALTVQQKKDTLWGVAICKDMDFTNPASLYGAAGAGLMLVPAWDFVADAWAHGHIALMRGVEGGYAIVRSAKQGFLYVSDDRGRVLAQAESWSSPFAAVVTMAPTGHEPTLYLRLGDWAAWLSVLLALLSIGRLLFKRGAAEPY